MAWMGARVRRVLAMLAAAVTGACAAQSPCRDTTPVRQAEMLPSEGEPPYASGLDLVWIGSASDIRFAYVAGSRAYLITHSRGALFGPDFGSLVSFGTDVPDRVFHADETSVYAVTRENDLVAVEPGQRPRTLFHAP